MRDASAEDLLKQMWEFANLITAFTVVQSLTVIYFALEKTATVREWREYGGLAIALILAGAGVYVLAIGRCYAAERQLRSLLGQHPLVMKVSRFAFYGRVLTTLAFNSMAASAAALALSRLKP